MLPYLCCCGMLGKPLLMVTMQPCKTYM
jgi:hypothetical protein